MSREGKHQTKNLIELEDEFIESKPLNIFCGTFNLAGQDPSESLAPWLKIDNTDIDVYAIGFQEIVDLTTTSLLLKTDWAKKEAAWTDAVNNQLLNYNPRSYKLITSVRMFGLYLLLYADENLSSNISEVYTSVLATGVLTMGNKGSIGISLKVHQTRISFICSHFAAHTQHIEKRNADFRIAWSNLKFQDSEKESSDFVGLEEHDVIFWFGDLNYRIDQLSVNDTLKLINSNSFEELLNYDQLKNERAKLAVFETFNEGEINFKPTFKYKIKTNLYEKEANLNVSQTEKDAVGNKIKLPSWTDRVLWKTVNNKVELIQYSSVNRITLSDHKPVYAVFKAEVKKINNEELRKAISELFTQLDKKSNEEMPHVSIDKKEFLFENCMFYDTRAQYFNVKNDGVSACNIEILYHDSLNKHIDDTEDYLSNINKSFLRPRQAKQWVSVLPQYKERVQPYSSFRVKLNLSFTFELLPQLNQSQIMEDFLIVKSTGGNHNFCSIVCQYKPTIIGISLKALSSLTCSFEESNQSHLINKIEADINEFEKKLDLLFYSNVQRLIQQAQKEYLASLINSNVINCQDNSFSRPKTVNSVKIYPSSDLQQKISTKQGQNPILSRINAIKKCLNEMKETIQDEYFNNPLSAEYEFFIDYLIKRLKYIYHYEQAQNVSMSIEEFDDESLNSLTIEEQKNFVLYYLSCKNFSDFENAKFDLDLLAQVLNDLLNALPHSLIPARYLDYCSYTNDRYIEAKLMLDYVPKSHSVLFRKIIRFLQINKICLNTCDSNFDGVLADSIFQIRKSDKSLQFDSSNNKSKREDNLKSLMAKNFINLFVNNQLLNEVID